MNERLQDPTAATRHERIARNKMGASGRDEWKAGEPETAIDASSGLTPELSRAAKRRRLGRIVRRDVKAEADLLQAVAATVMRESPAASREHHRGR